MLVLLCAVTCAYCQAELSIFAQLYYPRVQHVKPTTTQRPPPPPVVFAKRLRPVPVPVHLEVKPLRTYRSDIERSRRSAFDVDVESNNAMFRRLRKLMQDPNWVPEIRARHNSI